MKIAFVGGTGPAGIGLAARLATVGHEALIGSRWEDRAASAAEEVLSLAPGATVTSGLNADVVHDAEVVLLTLPYAAEVDTVETLRPGLDGKVVVSIANPITVEGGRVTYIQPAEGSLAIGVAHAAPLARVVSAFQEIHIRKWRKVELKIDSHTVVCGDDAGAKQTVMDLSEQLGVHAVDGGRLANSRYVEGFVALLVDINLRYKASTSLRITGLEKK